MHRTPRGRLADIAIGASQLPALRPVTESLKRLPLIRNWQERRRLAYFLSEEGFATFYGVFGSFQEARDALPQSNGHNQRALAAEYVNVRRHRVFSYDYPVIYWLSEAFRHGAASVFDIGGSVGVHYQAYRKILAYPPSLTWQVCDVAEIVQVGRELAKRSNGTQLTFTETLDPGTVQADIWISAGAIHYIEGARPSSLLAACKQRPRYFILNKLPLYEGEDFISAQNIGRSSYVPQYVYNRQRFLADIENVGYCLVDSWEVPECSFYLPGHPEKSFRKFSGLYFSAG